MDNPVFNESHSTVTFCLFWSLVKLTKNYTNFFQQNCRTPETLAEAIDQLQMILDTEQKASLVAMCEENLVNLHFSLGMVIRNAFRLHDPGSKLLASCNKALYPNALYNVIHPDDASGMIINKLWAKLNYGD